MTSSSTSDHCIEIDSLPGDENTAELFINKYLGVYNAGLVNEYELNVEICNQESFTN